MTKFVIKSVLTVATTALLFTGCGSTKPETPDFRCKQDGVLAPKWTCNPFVEDGIAAIGIAKVNAGNDKSLQRSEAMADGRDSLASQISTKVSNLFKSYKGTTGTGEAATYDATSSKVSKQIASQTLQGSKSVDAWINNKNGDLYLLVVTGTSTVKEGMDNAIKTSFKNDKAMYQKFLAAQAQGDLDKELTKAGMQE